MELWESFAGLVMSYKGSIASFLQIYEEITIIYVFIANTSYMVILLLGYYNALSLIHI